ncbi:hypothetical protein ABVT39_022458 [Epinephelus coioides]
MVDSCCAPGCHNSRHAKGRAFYRIPKDPERRQRWITAIKRARSEQKKTERWEPKGNGFRLCSDHFISGDLVLADRGFNVKDSVQSCQSELKIPAFICGKKQLDPVELENTRCLASLRIHIERIIGVLRQKYSVLQSTVPIGFTDIDQENDVTDLDKIVKCNKHPQKTPETILKEQGILSSKDMAEAHRNMDIAKEHVMNIWQILNQSKLPEFIYIILDSYIEMTLKEGECMRRTDSTTGIDIISMNRDTPIPQQLDKFWASEENKRNLQLLVQDMVCNRTCGDATILVSSVVSHDEVLPAKAAGGEEFPDLLNWIEEADARLVVHVEWAACVKQCKKVVVVSNDTDTFALLLHFTPYFQALGMEEIWQQYGTGEKQRMLPLHQAVSKLGVPLAKTVIKAHILTGDDCMSKVGTKHAALASDPVQYLTNFGDVDTVSEQDTELAEKYFVQVWAGARSSMAAETFDDLRQLGCLYDCCIHTIDSLASNLADNEDDKKREQLSPAKADETDEASKSPKISHQCPANPPPPPPPTPFRDSSNKLRTDVKEVDVMIMAATKLHFRIIAIQVKTKEIFLTSVKTGERMPNFEPSSTPTPRTRLFFCTSFSYSCFDKNK